MLAVFFIHQALTRPSGPAVDFKILLPLLFFGAFVIFQLVPLPESWISLISPARFELHQTFQQEMTGSTWYSLSLYPFATFQTGLKYLAVAGIFYLALRAFEAGTVLKLIVFLFVLCSITALIGILQTFWSPQKFFGLFPIPESLPQPFGSFRNENHFAGYLNLVLLPSVSLLVIALTRRKPLLFSVYFSFWIIAIFGLCLSQSLGGVLSFVGGLLAFLFLSLLFCRRKLMPIILIGLIISLSGLIFLYLFKIHPNLMQQYVQEFSNIGIRLSVYRDAARILQDFPWAGSGFGTFAIIYPLYQSFSSPFGPFHIAVTAQLQAREGGQREKKNSEQKIP